MRRFFWACFAKLMTYVAIQHFKSDIICERENNHGQSNSLNNHKVQSRLSDKKIVDSLLEQIKRVEDKATQWHNFQHLFRYAETIKICPAVPARVLDLGASAVYGPVLTQLLGYSIDGVEGLSFNYEKETFPLGDAQFDGAMFCEVIEHFTDDPMFCLIELNRVIKDGGFLVLTTPNAASWEAIYKLLNQSHSSRWPTYSNGGIGTHCIHVREYLVTEVVAIVEAAGFAVEMIHTCNYQPGNKYKPIGDFPQEHRGETIFCLARKISTPVKRYVSGIYCEQQIQIYNKYNEQELQTYKEKPRPRLHVLAKSMFHHLLNIQYSYIVRTLKDICKSKPEGKNIIKTIRKECELANIRQDDHDEKTLRLLLSELDKITDDNIRQRQSMHIFRYLETINLCPSGPAKVLDLGCGNVYDPVLKQVRGYLVEGVEGLTFNFEADRYPFEDSTFDGALLCEVIQQYTDDPMFSLIELNRVIKDGGFLVLTTANVAGWGAIYRALNQQHPSQWPCYKKNSIGAHCIYAREYLVSEIVTLVEAAGFAVEKIYTHNWHQGDKFEPIDNFSRQHRGETIFCLGRKVSLPKKRFVGGINGEDTPF